MGALGTHSLHISDTTHIFQPSSHIFDITHIQASSTPIYIRRRIFDVGPRGLRKKHIQAPSTPIRHCTHSWSLHTFVYRHYTHIYAVDEHHTHSCASYSCIHGHGMCVLTTVERMHARTRTWGCHTRTFATDHRDLMRDRD